MAREELMVEMLLRRGFSEAFKEKEDITFNIEGSDIGVVFIHDKVLKILSELTDPDNYIISIIMNIDRSVSIYCWIV